MNGMSPEASQLVNAGRLEFRPTDADRARFMTAVAGTATLSLGAAISAGGQSSVSGLFGMAQAARLLAIALPVAAVGAFLMYAQAPSPAAVQSGLHINVPSAPVAPSGPEPIEQVVEVEAPAAAAPSASVSTERSAPYVVAPSKLGSEIRQEVALLSKAQAALSRGRPQQALEALAEHAQRFPRGVLTEERAATRARTLCALGRAPEASTELKRLETLNPTSPYLARARESCGF